MIERVHEGLTEHRRALYSECGRYRYLLEITFRDGPFLIDPEREERAHRLAHAAGLRSDPFLPAERPPLLPIIGLNPSTATELEDDATIRREKDFARRWGFGGIRKANLSALRATDPRVMLGEDDPIAANTVDVVERLVDWGDVEWRVRPGPGGLLMSDFAKHVLRHETNTRERVEAFKAGLVELRRGEPCPTCGAIVWDPDPCPDHTVITLQHGSATAKTESVPRVLPIVLACWGAHGAHRKLTAHARAVVERFGDRLHAFGLTGNGQPKHPLYLRADAWVTPLSELAG